MVNKLHATRSINIEENYVLVKSIVFVSMEKYLRPLKYSLLVRKKHNDTDVWFCADFAIFMYG